MSRLPSIAIAALVAIVAIAAGMLFARSLVGNEGASQLGLAQATLLKPPRPLPQFALIDQAGAPFTPDRLKNRWSLLFFGFTRCPDVCPLTLGVLAQAEKALSDLPPEKRPQIMLVSVDPQRDNPAQLASYVKFFSPTFGGVTGTQDAIDELTSALGVPVAINKLPNGDYSVDHSAAIFLIDPNGALHALFSSPHLPAVIADDYRRIVTGG
jgi:protein SCO1/2